MDATLQDPLIGRTIDDRYRVQARIAVGGMATVYRALDTRLDRTLALKVMHPSLSTDTAFVERFIREAKSVARLDHPNVVGVTDQGTDGDYVYLAMELVNGCTLRDLAREGALTPRAVLDLLEPVAAGLAAAHRAGLVHRDVKPENVLIGDDGRVKVADFGLVRGVDTQTSAHTDSLLGTTSYLAPEQIESGTVGPAADVYACGIVLYELLTGEKPHPGESAAQILLAHVNRDVPPPSAVAPHLAPALDRLVASATARSLERRPQDAARLLAELHTARAELTDAELDAGPAGPVAVPAASEDVTQVVARPAVVDEPPATERTAVIELPVQGLGADAGGDGPPPPPRPPRAGRRRPWPLPRRAVFSLVGVVVLLLTAGLGLWYINSGQFVRTPGVYDLPRAEAEQALTEAGLRFEVMEQFSPNVAPGHVISTDPERGERIRRNGEVRVTVSLGPETVSVPDVSGLTLTKARGELIDAGLTPGEVTEEFSESVPRGEVIGSDPAADSELRPDGPVDLTVSRGAEVPVPDVVGESAAGAEEQLAEAGFEVEVDEERVHSPEPAGRVAATSPAPGSSAGTGETVTVTLSKGPEMVEVPDVRGLSEADATAELEAAGFEVRVQRLFFTGTVFNQSVHSGDTAPKGSEITIYVR